MGLYLKLLLLFLKRSCIHLLIYYNVDQMIDSDIFDPITIFSVLRRELHQFLSSSITIYSFVTF